MEINLKELYYKIKKLIDKIDFNELWPGFKPLKYALYTNNECFFNGEYIEKTDEFLANTSINYKGEVIAIWCVTDNTSEIVLASKMIHEMFHGFQMQNNETRFPDEIEALYKYKYTTDNLGIKLKENELINELIDNFDIDKYNKLLGYRKYRLNHFSYEYNYESKIEQIEGSANYVELMVLKKLSTELYNKSLNNLRNNIINKESFLPIRVISYDVGALLLKVINDNNIGIDKGFSDIPFSVSLLNNVNEKIIVSNSSFKELIDNYYNKANDIINKALSNNELVNVKETNLLGVNVYNAICYNNYIISTYFVMFGEKENPKVEYGNFVIECTDIRKARKIYKY